MIRKKTLQNCILMQQVPLNKIFLLNPVKCSFTDTSIEKKISFLQLLLAKNFLLQRATRACGIIQAS